MRAVRKLVNTRSTVQLRLGYEGVALGEMGFVQQGRRQFSVFAYQSGWLANPDRFEISPDLPLNPSFQTHKASLDGDAVFHAAIADTAPDAWGRRVIDRAHARARRTTPGLLPLTELEYLCAVDDFSRVGALRLQRDGQYLGAALDGTRRTPPLVELER